MEAVPKLSMLHFDLKYSPENTDFLLKLKKLIHVKLFIRLVILSYLQPFFNGVLCFIDLMTISCISLLFLEDDDAALIKIC